MGICEQTGDTPNQGGGKPYVVFKGRYGYLWGTPKITKTLPRAVLSKTVTDALASCPPSAGSSIRSLSFKYDFRRDQWVATTFMRQMGQNIVLGVLGAIGILSLIAISIAISHGVVILIKAVYLMF